MSSLEDLLLSLNEGLSSSPRADDSEIDKTLFKKIKASLSEGDFSYSDEGLHGHKGK